ncbi:hypothetical protein AG1IA_04430 [Rhizoctonia solani AG-1 IA]|uniref:F-box domain-containing protein n=1 Tax=Thanatephorus cucumeris (strain AG1-IA) TaxID=983506 RepID=L8WYT4_THACA|nr:hypothetical protein AG1IA_04430 [Rhizoctonia solani AG-1 IA]
MAKELTHRPKRRRARKENPYPDLALDRCYLAEVPLEVLSNILGYVYSIDLLALYRTSTYFHRTLKDPQQQHIWKNARICFPHFPIPAPVRISEIRVASLLFDDTTCSRDGKTYAKAWQKKTICRKSDIDMVMKDIDAGMEKAELQVKYECTPEQTAAFNCVCGASLSIIGFAYIQQYMIQLQEISSNLIQLKSRTDSQTRKLYAGFPRPCPILTMHRSANKKLSDYKGKEVQLSNSRQFVVERRRAIRSLRGFTDDDWNSIPPRAPTQNPAKPELTIGQIIIKEMDEMVVKLKRRKDETALRNTREAVKNHWQEMMNASGMSGQAGSCVPRWNEFALLPGVNSLLKPNGQDGALNVEDLQNKESTLTKMVQSNVDSWNSRTQGHFRKILKVPISKKNEVPEPGTVPPLDRVTALFECAKCKSVGLGLAQEGTLIFKSAVKHRCPGTSAKHFQWTTELFKPDQYGIQVAQHALALAGLVEDKTKRSDMDDIGLRFLCKLCTGKQPIYLEYRNLVDTVPAICKGRSSTWTNIRNSVRVFRQVRGSLKSADEGARRRKALPVTPNPTTFSHVDTVKSRCYGTHLCLMSKRNRGNEHLRYCLVWVAMTEERGVRLIPSYPVSVSVVCYSLRFQGYFGCGAGPVSYVPELSDLTIKYMLALASLVRPKIPLSTNQALRAINIPPMRFRSCK